MNKKTKEIYQYWYFKYKNDLFQLDKWIEGAKEKYSISTQKIISASMKHYLDKGFEIPNSSNTFSHNIRTISKDEFDNLYKNIVHENFYISNRNRTIFKVLWETGIRISELINLKWKDINDRYIKINGKGNIERTIPYKKGLFSTLKNSNEYVFVTINNKQISYSQLYKIFQRYKKYVKLDNFSPHVMRHSFASRLISKNISIEFLSKILGHSSINTTMIYIHFNDQMIVKFLNAI